MHFYSNGCEEQGAMDKKSLNTEIVNLETLQSLAYAYAQISSNRMKSIRESVVSSRDYLGDLNEIFRELRNSYKKEVEKLMKKKSKGGKPVTFLSHNGRTVSVLISANAGLYGEVVPRTFELFVKDVQEKGTEATIIGKLGLSLFLGKEPTRPHTYFDFPDFGVDPAKLGEIIGHLVQYEKIQIYYAKFNNIVNQEPAIFNLEAETPVATYTPEQRPTDVTPYLFEPSLEKILIFFETEMFGSLFEQTVKESQLAKFASRMLAMDTAGENVKGQLSKLKMEKLKYTHYISNRKQLDSMSAVFGRGR